MKKYGNTTESLLLPQLLVRLIAYIKSQRPSQLLRGTRPTVALILIGTFFVVILLFLLLIVSWLMLGNEYIIGRLIICLLALFYVGLAALFFRKNRTITTAWMLLGLYAFLASIILLLWSINAPVGILTLGFVILLSGVMLGARYIIPVTLAAVVLLICLQLAAQFNIVNPDHTSLRFESNFGDVAGYSIIFAIFAVVSWVSGRRMELTLNKALKAEVALEREKSLLAIRLDQQTKRLRESQLKEMQQLYHFAEMGQQSTVVLHELANSLAILTLDIEDIEAQNQRSAAVIRARESIDHLDTMVNQVRTRLQDTHKILKFNVVDLIQEVSATLERKAHKANVTLVLTPADKSLFSIVGDALKLSQIITILGTNAIESYSTISTSSTKRSVLISSSISGGAIQINVCDHGSGISTSRRRKLFLPYQSTKATGLGIGLYLAKSIATSHFKGSLSIDPRTDCTVFVLKIPQK